MPYFCSLQNLRAVEFIFESTLVLRGRGDAVIVCAVLLGIVLRFTIPVKQTERNRAVKLINSSLIKLVLVTALISGVTATGTGMTATGAPQNSGVVLSDAELIRVDADPLTDDFAGDRVGGAVPVAGN